MAKGIGGATKEQPPVTHAHGDADAVAFLTLLVVLLHACLGLAGRRHRLDGGVEERIGVVCFASQHSAAVAAERREDDLLAATD